MALNGKYRNIDAVIEKVHRDYGFTDINKGDCAEWIGEILGLIGEEEIFIQKQTDGNNDLCNLPPIEVRNGRAKLPCDLVKLISVKDAVTGVTLLESLDNFMPTFNDCKDGEIKFEDRRNSIQEDKGCEKVLSDGEENQLNYNELNKTYRVNNDFIFTNFDNGYLIMSYVGFPIDDEGYPLIPDDESFMRSASLEIAYNTAFKMAMRGSINERFLDRLARERDWYVGQAKNKAIIPNADKLESLKNMWVR